MSEPVGKVEEQVQSDRKQAFELLLGWLEEVHGHMATWKDANPNGVHRNALYFLVKTISDSCKGSYVLTDLELYDQAGALLRVAIENIWLLDHLGSNHPRAEETLKNWINGKRLQPTSVRKMLAEEFDEIDLEKTEHLQFMNDVYSELCNYIHPQPMSMSASAFERNLVVVLTSILGALPSFLCKFEVEIPDKLFQQGDLLVARIPVMLTNHQPQELREIVEDFSSFIMALSIERTGECGDT